MPGGQISMDVVGIARARLSRKAPGRHGIRGTLRRSSPSFLIVIPSVDSITAFPYTYIPYAINHALSHWYFVQYIDKSSRGVAHRGRFTRVSLVSFVLSFLAEPLESATISDAVSVVTGIDHSTGDDTAVSQTPSQQSYVSSMYHAASYAISRVRAAAATALSRPSHRPYWYNSEHNSSDEQRPR